MKSHSAALWQYLESSGALQGTEEDIIKAKREYRRQYKREHKKKRAQPKKELRPLFTAAEYKQLCIRATLYGFSHPTPYIKQLILSDQEDIDLIPNKEVLLQILQYISMGTIAFANADTSIDIPLLLTKAEIHLLRYLNLDTTI